MVSIPSMLRWLIPGSLKRSIVQVIRQIAADEIRRSQLPTMVWGYQSPDGFRAQTRLSNTAYVYHPERVHIADNVFVWHHSILDGTGGIEIGEGCQIGAWVGIFTHSSHKAIRIYGRHYTDVAEDEKEFYVVKKVKIGKYVFIGAGAKVLPGVTIGDGALIGAGALVRESVPPFAIVEGSPAQVVGSTETLDKRALKSEKFRTWYDQWQEANMTEVVSANLPE